MYEERILIYERYIEQKYVYLQKLTGEMVRDIESVFLLYPKIEVWTILILRRMRTM